MMTPFRPPLRSVTITDQVYELLRDRYMHAGPAPGSRVIEKDLTDELGVSRTPVRDALARLTREGILVATRHGYRTPVYTEADILNLTEVRLLLEPVAAAQAATSRTDHALTEMRAAIAEEQAAHETADVPAFQRAHLRFRNAWLKDASNPHLLEALGKTIHALQLIRRTAMSDAASRLYLIESHELLLDAIERGDAAVAERVQAERIQGFKSLLLGTMQRGFPGTEYLDLVEPD